VDGYGGRGGKIHCRRGCGSCCSLAVQCTFTEALGVAEVLPEPLAGELGRRAGVIVEVARSAKDLAGWLRGYRREAQGCSFLAGDGVCAVYQHRPFACRALLSTRNPDWCAVDLSALHPLEKKAFLSSLDPSLVSYPTHYAAAPQEAGAAYESAAAHGQLEMFGFSVAGNLPFLVWLEREYRLSTIFTQGAAAVNGLLEREGLNIPFLVQLQRRRQQDCPSG
jgi:hypothetical protein